MSVQPDRPAWFVINLDRSPDRLAAMSENLGGLGVPFTRIAAVDGRSLALPIPGVDPRLYVACHGRDLLPGEVGCALSHLRALKTFVATPHRHAVILEDDAVVTRAAVDLVSALAAPSAPDDWDLVKLEAHHAKGGLAVRRIAPGVRLCAMPYRSGGSAAYLLDRSAAAALLAGLLPMRFPYDVAFERGWDFGIRVRTVLPPPVTTAAVPPTLARDAGAGARRAPALLRARSKAMYAATALSAWLAARHPAPRARDPSRCAARFDLAERALAGCRPPGSGREGA